MKFIEKYNDELNRNKRADDVPLMTGADDGLGGDGVMFVIFTIQFE